MQTLFIFLLAFTSNAHSDSFESSALIDPVKWTFEVEKMEDGSFELTASADISNGWYLYSQHNTDEGPVPTSFTFEENSKNTLTGDVLEEGKLIKEYDELFEMDISKYKSSVIFRQKYKSTNAKGLISGYVTFMTCDGLKCLPPKDIDFNVSI